jgi:hypothetical protein
MAAAAKADHKSIRAITFSGAPSEWFTYKQHFIMKFSCLGHGGHLAKSVKAHRTTPKPADLTDAAGLAWLQIEHQIFFELLCGCENEASHVLVTPSFSTTSQTRDPPCMEYVSMRIRADETVQQFIARVD